MSSAQREFRVNFISSIKTTVAYKCMAVHPIYPLLAVCDDNENLCLHRINNPEVMHLPLIQLGKNVDVNCIAFHATHPLVAASSNETGQITFWNIQEVIARLDEVPFNVEERRRELKRMLSQPGDASELEKLEEELEYLEDYQGSKLKPFATVTMVNPTYNPIYITFHPTMPYIVVGGVDHESASSFIKIFEVNAESVEVNSIELPMDEDEPYDKIESIVFSHDGVFLAATFGEVIIVWFFSPTEEMKQLMNLRLSNEVNSLVFSPIDYILVASYSANWHNTFRSFKIEKDSSSVPENLTTVEGWTATNIEHYHPAAAASASNRMPPGMMASESSISTLAFHPTLPLLVGSFDNGDVKYYVFDIDDHLSELTRFGFTNPIPFQDSSRRPSVALNRRFLVTCGSNQVRVYTMDGVESAVGQVHPNVAIARTTEEYMAMCLTADKTDDECMRNTCPICRNEFIHRGNLVRPVMFHKTVKLDGNEIWSCPMHDDEQLQWANGHRDECAMCRQKVFIPKLKKANIMREAHHRKAATAATKIQSAIRGRHTRKTNKKVVQLAHNKAKQKFVSQWYGPRNKGGSKNKKNHVINVKMLRKTRRTRK